MTSTIEMGNRKRYYIVYIIIIIITFEFRMVWKTNKTNEIAYENEREGFIFYYYTFFGRRTVKTLKIRCRKLEGILLAFRIHGVLLLCFLGILWRNHYLLRELRLNRKKSLCHLTLSCLIERKLRLKDYFENSRGV